MKRSSKWVVSATGVVGIAAAAFFAGRAIAGGIPATAALTYSGLLESASGPLTGDHPIQVSFWTAAAPGGTQTVCYPSATVTLTNGRFSVPLSDPCTDLVKANKDIWVEVLADGVSLGRTKLGAVPYAVEAGHATSADTATSATTAATANAAGGALKTTIDGLAAKTDLARVSAWAEYQPTLTVAGTASSGVTSNIGLWRRVGDSIEVMITTRFDPAAAGGSTDARLLIWGLPTSYQPSRLKGEPYALGSAVTGSATSIFGACVVDTESGAGNGVFVLCHGTDAIRRSEVGGPSGKTIVMLHFTVPIVGWTLTTPSTP